MTQYRPEGLVPRGDYPEIDRRPTRDEYARAVEIARSLGLHRLDAGSLLGPWGALLRATG
jgi:uncharacterized Fe-S radical SAM superfamily protein PflX